MVELTILEAVIASLSLLMMGYMICTLEHINREIKKLEEVQRG